ncbi:MAG: TonB-dependent receptor plug domain-containing protein, partial [Bacteroidales bacterium]|nr:TonB-dependent receptor plug domain-containing protein [Bacteroidales bacterium]
MSLKGIIWIGFCLIASAVHAQGLEDSVFHIMGVEIKAERIFDKEKAGMKETEIDSVVLREKVTLSLSDLLSENTPIFIKNHGRGALATASFRGTAASHTQVSWNGIHINSPMAGMVDFSLIPVYIIDELNLKHGSASVADRSGGIGGSININNSVRWDHENRLKY